MKKISYDTTGQGRVNDAIIFEIFGNISANGIVRRNKFHPAIIETVVNNIEDANYAEYEINFNVRENDGRHI